MSITRRFTSVLPGITLCVLISLAGCALERAEDRAFGHAPLEALVLAILIGAALRGVWAPGPRFVPGIRTSAKLLLEVAVMLLGASVSAASLAAVRANPEMFRGRKVVLVLSGGNIDSRRLASVLTRERVREKRIISLHIAGDDRAGALAFFYPLVDSGGRGLLSLDKAAKVLRGGQVSRKIIGSDNLDTLRHDRLCHTLTACVRVVAQYIALLG